MREAVTITNYQQFHLIPPKYYWLALSSIHSFKFSYLIGMCLNQFCFIPVDLISRILAAKSHTLYFLKNDVFEVKLNYFYNKLYNFYLIKDLYSSLPCESLVLFLWSPAVLQHMRKLVTIGNAKMAFQAVNK